MANTIQPSHFKQHYPGPGLLHNPPTNQTNHVPRIYCMYWCPFFLAAPRIQLISDPCMATTSRIPPPATTTCAATLTSFGAISRAFFHLHTTLTCAYSYSGSSVFSSRRYTQATTRRVNIFSYSGHCTLRRAHVYCEMIDACNPMACPISEIVDSEIQVPPRLGAAQL